MLPFKTLPDLIFKSLERCNKETLLASKQNGEWVKTSSKELLDSIRSITAALHNHGIKPGDTVAIYSESRTQWIIADAAIMSLGAVTVPIYPQQTIEQANYILEHSEAKFLFFSSEPKFNLQNYVDDFSWRYLKGICCFDSAFKHHDILSFNDFLKTGQDFISKHPDFFDSCLEKLKPSDLAIICYTSGTTGNPKGVMLSHANVLHSVIQLSERVFYVRDLKPNEISLSMLPFSHILEHACVYGYIKLNATLYILPNTDEAKQTILSLHPAHFTAVPHLIERIYAAIHDKAKKATGLQKMIIDWAFRKIPHYTPKTPKNLCYKIADFLVYSKIRQGLGGNLKGMSCGGAALSPEIARFFNAIGIPTGEGYGLTEASPVVSVYTPDLLKFGSAGKIVDGVEVKIADDQEILVRGPNVMQGYFKDPVQTAAAIRNGWLYTGDIGYVDDDNFLYITDRKKDLFKLSTGKYIAPAPIETRAMISPFIGQILVVGYNEKFCGALIYPNHETLKTALEGNISHDKLMNILQAEIDLINQPLPHWEKIKKFVILDTPFSFESGELTHTLKKKRRMIEMKRKDIIKSLYSQF